MDRYDVIVVGGNFAGLSAAMQLVRGRRRVLLIDAGQPRNRFAHASHGFLTQDGAAPVAIAQTGLQQLSRYPTFTLVADEALEARAEAGGFIVTLARGAVVCGRKLILATGVADELPLPSMTQRWGVSVLHCPYCHGFEVADRPLAAIANVAAAVHQALLLPDWGPTTFFTQGRFEPSPQDAALLAARGVVIERVPVVELLGPGAATTALRLADGRQIAAEAVFTAPRTRMASRLAEQLGCKMLDGMTGPYIEVDGFQLTSVPGVFAAGDAASPMYNATLASATGVMAGAAAHRAVILDEATQSRAA